MALRIVRFHDPPTLKPRHHALPQGAKSGRTVPT